MTIRNNVSPKQLQSARDAADREAIIADIARQLEARGCSPEFARECAEYEVDHD